jgi:hypothetical protein
MLTTRPIYDAYLAAQYSAPKKYITACERRSLGQADEAMCAFKTLQNGYMECCKFILRLSLWRYQLSVQRLWQFVPYGRRKQS